jgi:hypothetical protein
MNFDVLYCTTINAQNVTFCEKEALCLYGFSIALKKTLNGKPGFTSAIFP